MSRDEVHEMVTNMGEEYKGNLYHLLQRNCNHFSADFAYRLCQATPPAWVSRLHLFSELQIGIEAHADMLML